MAQVNATSFQNNGDTVPDWNEIKRNNYSNMIPKWGTKEVDSPLLLKQLYPASYPNYNRRKTLCLTSLIKKTFVS